MIVPVNAIDVVDGTGGSAEFGDPILLDLVADRSGDPQELRWRLAVTTGDVVPVAVV